MAGRRLRVKGLFVTWVRDGWIGQKPLTEQEEEIGTMFPSAQNKCGRQLGGTHTNMLQTLKHVR